MIEEKEKGALSSSTLPIVGIDLGTTNSAVAFISHGQPHIIPSPQGLRIIPSVVMLDMQGQVLVGEVARAAQVAMPDRVVAAIKRKMGSKQAVEMAGQQFLPQEISAMILKELKSYADAQLGAGEKEAIITVPAYFTDEQRRATKQAGELAGFVVERIINEPTAAALAFGFQQLDEDQQILVYDLGGGTFDVSIVEMMGGILDVKASAGNNMLGGEDFDWLLVDWLAAKMMKANNIDPRKDIRARSLLKEQAEKIKIELSNVEKVTIQLPLVMMKNNRPIGLNTEINRQEFVNLIAPLLSETMDCVQRALDDAKVSIDEIQEILLVGGSTRIPEVRTMIVDFFKKEPRSDVNPDEAVALGAAVQAGLKAGLLSDSGLIVTDIAPFSLGLAIVKDYKGSQRSGVFSVLIPRNTTIPVTRTEQFYTGHPYQTEAEIEIYQGEHDLVKHNHCLGNFLLEGIPSNGKSVQAINVTYSYNLNGILEVTAESVLNKTAKSLTVHDALERDSEDLFVESVAKLEELYKNVSPEEDEDGDEELFNMFFGDDDEEDVEEDDDDEENHLARFHKQIALLRPEMTKVLASCNELQKKKMKKLERKLDKMLLTEDVDEIQEIVDEITDLLIELEMQED